MADLDNVTRLVQAELRCAYLRAKTAEHEITQISELLKANATTPADALIALEQLGWASFLGPEIRQLVEAAKPRGAK